MGEFSFHTYFTNNPEFHFEDGVFFQHGLGRKSEFENSYVGIREKESRVYSDEIVRKLPLIHTDHPRATEWRIRKTSADLLIQYLKKKEFTTILEIGCGNGWLTQYMHQHLHAQQCGIDVNETELKQAARLIGNNQNLVFAYADIFQLKTFPVDIIILGSCLQYFSNVNAVVTKLKQFLSPRGEIHIFDSPVYTESTLAAARERSAVYFSSMGFSEMSGVYFHHTYSSFGEMKYEVLHNPHSLLNRIKKLVTVTSPFPWIRIKAY